MQHCLALAELGRHRVGNGAMVGAVLVREGKIIAEGYHAAYGTAHAERMLLENFTSEIFSNDILYVNLEPCCHQGKTPPCTDILLERGVKHVVFGMFDPDQRVRGKSVELLKQQGVLIDGPLGRTHCERLNRGFVTVRTLSRPWITLKMAMNTAGFISKSDGSTLKITSYAQDIFAHTYLRHQSDAILVGVQTVITDDPQLDERFRNIDYKKFNSALIGKENSMYKKCELYRIILDPHFRIPSHAKVLNDENASRTMVLTQASIAEIRQKNRGTHGAKVISMSVHDEFFVWESLWKILLEPVDEYHGITSLLVEGGAKTWQAFRSHGYMDEEVVLTGHD